MTESGGVNLTACGAVAVVEFSRPPHNYFDLELVESLNAAFAEVDGNSEQRCILLRSPGKTFCAGAAFSGTGGISVPDGPNIFYERALKLFDNATPIVAAVQGAAIGGGLGLALVADLRVASPDAAFSANFAKIGLHPGFGMTASLPRAIGEQRAADLLLTGRRVGGEEAYRIGLIDRLVPADALQDEAMRLAEEVAANAPLAVQATRATIRIGLSPLLRAALDREWAEQKLLFVTEDFREGVNAVKERRAATWVGR